MAGIQGKGNIVSFLELMIWWKMGILRFETEIQLCRQGGWAGGERMTMEVSGCNELSWLQWQRQRISHPKLVSLFLWSPVALSSYIPSKRWLCPHCIWMRLLHGVKGEPCASIMADQGSRRTNSPFWYTWGNWFGVACVGYFAQSSENTSALVSSPSLWQHTFTLGTHGFRTYARLGLRWSRRAWQRLPYTAWEAEKHEEARRPVLSRLYLTFLPLSMTLLSQALETWASEFHFISKPWQLLTFDSYK